MLKTAKGDVFSCDECGMIISVAESCECDDSCELICCGVPMAKGKIAARNVRKKAVAKKVKTILAKVKKPGRSKASKK
jgi:hypothetical protein